MNFIKNNYVLLAIVFLAIFLRFNQLGDNPPSLTWDEVAWGYNAYALGIDGKDEFGRFLPHDYLESFGDFKPPLYAYADIIPIKLFGLTEFAVRFPSAFFGSLTILFTYFLVKNIFYSSPQRKKYALFTALLLAVSPWHILLSRAAFEANVATFFIVSGVWLFIAAIHKRPYLLIFSALAFVLSLYTFNSARIVSPLLVIVLTIGFRKELFKIKKHALISVVVGLLLFLPIVQFLFSPQASLRFKEVNIFSDIEIVERANQQIANDGNAWWSKIMHNRRLAYGGEFIRHYLDNINTDFLFIHGDGNPKFSTRDLGQMYVWEIPFLAVGLLFLIRKRESHWWIVPLWFLLGIIPAGTARETPHALRTEAILPTLQIIVAIGVVTFFTSGFYKKRKNVLKFAINIIVFGFLLLNVLNFHHIYYSFYPKLYSGEWQYGYKESIAFVSDNIAAYDEAQITDNLGRPYIYYLFYTQTHPEDFRKTAKISRDPFGFVKVEQFGKYRFIRKKHEPSKKTLYIDTPGDVPDNALQLKNFNLLNGAVTLQAYTL